MKVAHECEAQGPELDGKTYSTDGSIWDFETRRRSKTHESEEISTLQYMQQAHEQFGRRGALQPQ